MGIPHDLIEYLLFLLDHEGNEGVNLDMQDGKGKLKIILLITSNNTRPNNATSTSLGFQLNRKY